MKRIWSFLVAALASASLAWAGDAAQTALKIEGMTCSGCVPAVNVQLRKTEGVVAYEVSFEKGEAVVSYDRAKTTPARIAESVSRTGYTASVKGQGDAAPAATSGSAPSAKTGAAGNGGSLERVTLFQVPLTCPAVKGLGCGGKARPFMAELEKQADVDEAWLNHPGTVLAVVWKEPRERARATSVVGSLFQTKGMSVTALDGAPLNEALADFAARRQWYRGQDVNRLSEQEGVVFTERMAKRVEARTKLSPASSSALRADLRKFCVDMLLGLGSRDTKTLLELAAKYMDPAQLKIYEAALGEEFRALPGESLS
jgi:mercuric ion binding protein